MRLSGTHLFKRVCPSVGRSVHWSVRPSVGWSVGPLRLCKNRVSQLFLTTLRSYTEKNDHPTFWEPFLPVCLSIFLSKYVTWSIHNKSPDASLPGRACSSCLSLFLFFFFSKTLRHARLLPSSSAAHCKCNIIKRSALKMLQINTKELLHTEKRPINWRTNIPTSTESRELD